MPSTRTHPFSFILDELLESPLGPRIRTKPMFGSLAVYVGEKIVFILRRKQKSETLRDDGIWIATQPEHNLSLIRDFPTLRRIEMFETRGREGFTGWLNLPEDSDSFEESALEAARLVIRADPRIGKIPKSTRKRKKK